MEYIERQISETVKEASTCFPVICITGPRQSGKSTLIKNTFPDYVRFSMEDLNVREYALNDPIAFLGQTDKGMILDEIQRTPELMSYIQGIVDENPERKFILSGSSNFILLKTISQSLAGRAGLFELLPMTYQEASESYSGLTLDELIFNGLYPAIVAGKNKAKFLYPSYVKTYLDKDVRDLIQVKDQTMFNTFLKLCAGRIGSIFNASELANDIGVSSKTISSWLSVLEASYIIFRLQPYYENTGKRLTKSPKIYFCDTGLACYLLDIESPKQLSRDKMRGPLFENFIVTEALKSRFNQGKEGNIYFYRDSNNNEIDLITSRHGVLDGIEIKSGMTYNTSFETVLRKMDLLVKGPIGTRTVVYTGEMENTAGEIKLVNYRNLRFD